jgi:NhaC family Na+:H+ antiporter
VFGFSVLWALALGLVLFCWYAAHQGHSLAAIARMLWQGVRKVMNIMIILALIGFLTAVWRSGGTISYIIVHSLEWINPAWFAVWSFLLCALMSILLGSAFGTVTTFGVILMILARTAGMNELLVAGAIMSGIYVGDRCSPMSSSALLVCALTSTNIYNNIEGMCKSAALPFALTCVGYTVLSMSQPTVAIDMSVISGLEDAFNLNAWAAIPAALIIVLSLLRVDVKISMLCSIATGCALSLFEQGLAGDELFRILIWGFHPAGNLAFLDGGGLVSMLKVLGVLVLSSSYAGIFDATGLLKGFTEQAVRLARVCGRFASTTLMSIPIAAVSCNQSLATIMTVQVCGGAYRRPQDMAIHLEDSVVLITAMIPWSVACVVPLAALGEGGDCLVYAFYLYLVPLVNILVEQVRRPHAGALNR